MQWFWGIRKCGWLVSRTRCGQANSQRAAARGCLNNYVVYVRRARRFARSLTHNLILQLLGGDGRQPVVHAQVALRQQLQLRRALRVRPTQQGAARGRVQDDHGGGGEAGDRDGRDALSEGGWGCK